MIERLHLIATHLRRFRWLIIAIAALSLALAVTSLMDASWSQGEALTLPAIVAFCWAVTLYSHTELFARPLPVLPPGAPWRTRLALRFRRALRWVLALLMAVLSFFLVVLSWQLLRAWFVS